MTLQEPLQPGQPMCSSEGLLRELLEDMSMEDLREAVAAVRDAHRSELEARIRALRARIAKAELVRELIEAELERRGVAVTSDAGRPS